MLQLEEDDLCSNKQFYYEELQKYYSAHEKNNRKPWTLAKIEETINLLETGREAIENGQKRTNDHYYYSRIYETIEIGDTKAIIKKRTNDNQEIIFMVAYEHFYDKLVELHLNTNHGGRDKMLTAMKYKYSIPRPAVEIFVKCCTRCAGKKQPPKKAQVLKPIISKEWNHRGQVHFIDLQSTPDGEYKWLMNYQDHFTKFCHLRPLKSKSVEEVSAELLKIFLQFGAPIILHCNNGRTFVNNVIKQITLKWPSCKIISGRPRQRQGSVERSSQDVENMLRAWLRDNNSTNWSLGCYFIQWQKNSSYHRIIERSPYKTLFGTDFPLGLSSSNLPSQTVIQISTEEELEKLSSPQEARQSQNIMILDYNQSDPLQLPNDPSVQVIDEFNDIEHFNQIKNNVLTEVIQHQDGNKNNRTVNCAKCSKKNSFDQVKNELVWLCDLCRRQETIQIQRQGYVAGQKRGAEKMLEETKQKWKPLSVGQIVAIEAPKFDSG